MRSIDQTYASQRSSPSRLATRRGRARGEIEVRAVRGRRELSEFIRLPWRLYRGVANWVPPLLSERRHTGTAAAFYAEIMARVPAPPNPPRRDRLDPRGQRADEPRHAGAWRRHRQALPALRARDLKWPLLARYGYRLRRSA